MQITHRSVTIKVVWIIFNKCEIIYVIFLLSILCLTLNQGEINFFTSQSVMIANSRDCQLAKLYKMNEVYWYPPVLNNGIQLITEKKHIREFS